VRPDVLAFSLRTLPCWQLSAAVGELFRKSKQVVDAMGFVPEHRLQFIGRDNHIADLLEEFHFRSL